jgi:hypothetical protein
MYYGPPESYWIARLVAGHIPSQAQKTGWQTNNDFTTDLIEMPVFSLHRSMKKRFLVGDRDCYR